MEIRKFIFKGQELPDPGPSLSPEEVKGLYSAQNPELTTAGVKELKAGENGESRYEFTVNVGRKG